MAHVRHWSMAAGLALAALLAGCTSGGSASGGSAGGQASTPAAAGYWTHNRLLGAQPSRDWSLPKLPSPGATPTAQNPLLAVARVGALFIHYASSDRVAAAADAARCALPPRRERPPLLHGERRRQPRARLAGHGGALHPRRQGQPLQVRHRVHPRLPGRRHAVRSMDAAQAARRPAVGGVL